MRNPGHREGAKAMPSSGTTAWKDPVLAHLRSVSPNADFRSIRCTGRCYLLLVPDLTSTHIVDHLLLENWQALLQSGALTNHAKRA